MRTKNNLSKNFKHNENKNAVKKAAEKIAEVVTLVPGELLLLLWFVSLVMPNLVYSGVKFADTLHILKWTVTAAPIAIAVLVAGARLLLYGKKRGGFEPHFDLFSLLWFILLVYCALQFFWTDISSVTGFIHELACFAAVWAFYVLSADSFPDWGLRPVLWLANINGAINVLFAELQIRNMNNLAFLNGTPFEFLTKYSSIILPTPYNYIGNTAQKNMLALWLAICVMNSIYLFIAYALNKEGKKRPLVLTVLNLLLMLANIWGLWQCSSRSGFLSFGVGLFVLALITILRYGRAMAIRLGIVLAVCAVFLAGVYFSMGAGGGLISKVNDMIQNTETIGGRRGIWTTSYAMFREHPMGVGIGQYKWHYLEAQREGFKMYPEPWYTWQYTHWAHNEFLQWFCEAGVIGGILLILMYLVWIAGIIMEIIRRKKDSSRSVSPAAIWGCALISLVSFNALWTRPFHRIENIVWLALAFALTNREFLSGKLFKINLSFKLKMPDVLLRLSGILFMGVAIAGMVYLWSGIQGNMLLRQALSTTKPQLQIYLLEEANKHPIVYEEVQRNLGYHYFQIGDQTHDLSVMGKGFNLLWQHFKREPHSEDMNKLIQWSQRFQVEAVIRELASYLKPGTYHLERRPGRDVSGKEVSALVIVNGPEPK